MARPTFVIGLGGTGQWVLTYLKNELQEINNGAIPKEVQLLGFDTQSPNVKLEGAGTLGEGDGRMGQLTDAQVGNIRLDPINEFFQIGSPLMEKVVELDNAKPKPQEYEWLDTGYFRNLGPLVLNTIYGAGAYRPLGRLSLFNKASEIYQRLYNGLKKGQQAISNRSLRADGKKDALSVIIVTSLAGGTGSGIFLDIAWLLRTAARNLNFAGYNLSAFLVMPTAFEMSGQKTNNRLSAYAAWKELDRFMLYPGRFSETLKISYLPNQNPPLEAKCDVRIFDNTYLIDPVGSVAHQEPDKGTFPVVAQTISSLIDNRIGEAIAEDMSNVAAEIGKIPFGVYHNSAGAFTFKTPHHFANQQSFNEFSLAVLERLIEPDYGPSGEAVSVRQDRNQETKPSTTGHGASTFLKAADHGGYKNNALLRQIETVSTKGDEINKYAIEQARKLVDRGGDVFQAITKDILDPDLAKELNQLGTERIWQVVPPSGDRNTTPKAIRQQILTQVEAKDEEWYGQWGYEVDPRNPAQKIQKRITDGSKVQLLRRVANNLSENYKTLLEQWTANQLNGQAADAEIAKGGKLGYVIGVYKDLDYKFNQYLAFLEHVKVQIANQNTRGTRTGARDKARRNYDQLAGKECFFAFFDNNVHPHARDAERNFLRSTDKLFEYYLSEYVLKSLAEAVRAIQTYTAASKAKLEQWVRILAVGKQDGDPEKRYKGLYDYGWSVVRTGANGLQAEIRMGNPNFEQNRELRGVQQMLDVQAANVHYQNNNRVEAFQGVNHQVMPYMVTQDVRNALNMFVWTVRKDAGSSELNFDLELIDENDNRRRLNNIETSGAIAENYSIFSSAIKPHYTAQLQEGTPIVQLLSEKFPDAAVLAQQLKVLSKPLYSERGAAGIENMQNHMFMRLDASANPNFFTNLENNLKGQVAGPHELVDPNSTLGTSTSEDEFKFTFLQFHYLMKSKRFALNNNLDVLFQQTMARYDLSYDPRTNYIFNAEKQAHRLAIKRQKMNHRNFDSFVPEVVSLLEKSDRTELFFLAFAQGMLTFTSGGGLDNTKWILDYGDGSEKIILYDKNENQTDDAEKCTVYEAIRYWIIGKDCRPNFDKSNRINWDKLRHIIRENEKSSKQIIEDYKAQIDENNTRTIMALINLQLMNTRSQLEFTFELLPGHVNVDQSDVYNDLADLAKTILQERIELLSQDNGAW